MRQRRRILMRIQRHAANRRTCSAIVDSSIFYMYRVAVLQYSTVSFQSGDWYSPFSLLCEDEFILLIAQHSLNSLKHTEAEAKATQSYRLFAIYSRRERAQIIIKFINRDLEQPLYLHLYKIYWCFDDICALTPSRAHSVISFGRPSIRFVFGRFLIWIM